MAYSDKKRAETLVRLAQNKGDVAKTAREMGLTRKTIMNWAKQGMPDYSEALAIIDEKLAEALEQMPDFSKPGNAHSWPNAIRELVRARQLLAGEATERTESRNANVNVSLSPFAGLDPEDRAEMERKAIATLLPERTDLHGLTIEEMDVEDRVKALKKSFKVLDEMSENQQDENYLEA